MRTWGEEQKKQSRRSNVYLDVPLGTVIKDAETRRWIHGDFTV